MGRHVAVTTLLFILLFSSSASADRYPNGFSSHKFNGSTKPTTQNGVTTFHINDRECSKVDYGDGRGENDCHNGNVRSNLHGPDERVGDSVEYRFDIWVDPATAYPGFNNDHAIGFLPGAMDSRLRIASWEGTFLHNFLYILKLDATNGITFLGKVCQPKKQFGEWVTFSMKVRWAGDKTGWIKVACDDSVLYSAQNLATNQAPHCYITNQCEPGVAKNPRRFIFTVGPVMAGFGFEWKKYGLASQFTQI